MFNLSRQCVICWKKITTLLKMDDQLIISVDPYWIWYKRRLTFAINFFKIVKFLWSIVRVWKRFSLPSNGTRGVFLDKTTFLDSDGFVFPGFSPFFSYIPMLLTNKDILDIWYLVPLLLLLMIYHRGWIKTTLAVIIPQNNSLIWCTMDW